MIPILSLRTCGRRFCSPCITFFGILLFAARSHRVSQSAHLPEPRDPGTTLGVVQFRSAPRRISFSWIVGICRERSKTLCGDRQKRSYLQISRSDFETAITADHGKWEVHIADEKVSGDQSPISFGAIHHKIVEEYAPPSVLINEEYDIVHSSENAGRFLHFAAGEPSRNLLNVVHPALRLDLRAALAMAKQETREAEVQSHFRSRERGPDGRFDRSM